MNTHGRGSMSINLIGSAPYLASRRRLMTAVKSRSSLEASVVPPAGPLAPRRLH